MATRPTNRFQEIGVSGLNQQGGILNEEWLRQLTGTRGRLMLREMTDNDPLIGAVLLVIEMCLRRVPWMVKAFDDSPENQNKAEFVESLMNDMSHTWGDFIAEVTSMLPFGFSPHEIVYKRRVGPETRDARGRSKYRDNLIGWRKMPLRAQETVDRWEFDEDGGISGLYQMDTTGGGYLYIPIEKLLIFRTTSRKNSPEGRSILRNAYVPYFYRKRTQELESTGMSRDLAGFPIFWLPPEYFGANVPADKLAQRNEFQRVLSRLNRDEQSGLILPAIYDANGNQVLRFELAGTGARRQYDTSSIISRYRSEMVMSMMADFILLGHEKVGSFALSSDKTDLFAVSLGAWLDEIGNVLNRHALPRLYALNGWDAGQCAEFIHGDIEKQDLEKFAQAVGILTANGWLTPGGEDDENYIRELFGMPAKAPDPVDGDTSPDDQGEDDDLTPED